MLKQAQSVTDFENTINTESPVLVEFFMPWCPYCKAFFPNLEAYAAESGSIPVMQVNGEALPQVFEAYGIESYPTVMVFVDGQPVLKEEGGMEVPELKEFIDQAIR